jgi:hypothetical protein
MMDLTSAQRSQIAVAYERAAQDETLPPQPRAGFAKKARWFRMLAQIGAAKEAAPGEGADKGSCPNAQQEPLLCAGFLVEALNRRRRVSPSISN